MSEFHSPNGAIECQATTHPVDRRTVDVIVIERHDGENTDYVNIELKVGGARAILTPKQSKLLLSAIVAMRRTPSAHATVVRKQEERKAKARGNGPN